MQEHRLRAFENRVLRKILKQHLKEVAGGWRKLHTEALNGLYASPSMLRVIKSRTK
jgi:hypothetical protein